MEIEQLWGLAGVPVVVALVQASKPWIKDKRLWPWAGIFWGVLLNLGLAYVLHLDYATAAIVGVVVGLAASGLYSGGKATREGRTPHG